MEVSDRQNPPTKIEDYVCANPEQIVSSKTILDFEPGKPVTKHVCDGPCGKLIFGSLCSVTEEPR